MLIRTQAVALLLMLLATGAQGQTSRASLFSVLSSGEYFGTTYAESAAPLTFTFFVGEPIKLQLIIGNRGPERGLFTFPNPSAPDMFVVDATRDGSAFAVQVAFGSGQFESQGRNALPYDSAQPMHLEPKEQVRWRGVVVRPLPPGRYRIGIRTTAVDERGRKIPPHIASHEFEVRPITAEARVEVLRRVALRHFVAGDAADLELAEQALMELLLHQKFLSAGTDPI